MGALLICESEEITVEKGGVETASPCIGPRQQDLRTVCKINKVCQATKHRNAFIFLGLSRFYRVSAYLMLDNHTPLYLGLLSKNKSRSLVYFSLLPNKIQVVLNKRPVSFIKLQEAPGQLYLP